MDNKKILIGAGILIIGYLLWKKSKKNSITKSDIIVPQNASVRPLGGGKDELGMPRVTEGSKEEWKAIELRLKVDKLPDEFIVKSNGYATRYYKVKETFIPTLYKRSFTTDGSDGGSPPIKISNDEFLKAYDVFLQQPK